MKAWKMKPWIWTSDEQTCLRPGDIKMFRVRPCESHWSVEASNGLGIYLLIDNLTSEEEAREWIESTIEECGE